MLLQRSKVLALCSNIDFLNPFKRKVTVIDMKSAIRISGLLLAVLIAISAATGCSTGGKKVSSGTTTSGDTSELTDEQTSDPEAESVDGEFVGEESGESDTAGENPTNPASNGNGTGKNNPSSKTPSQTSSDAKGEVTIWFWQTQAQPHIQDIIKTYNNKKSGITIKASFHAPTGGSLSGFDDKLLPALAAKNGPDLFLGSPNYANLSKLEELTSYITSRQDNDFKLNNYYEFCQKAIKPNGKYMGMPFDCTYGGFLLYNKTMFKAAGLDPNKPPKTLDELWNYAEKMYKPKADKSAYETMGFVPWEWLMGQPGMIVRPFGGKWFTDDGKPNASSAEVKAAMNWVVKWSQKYGYDMTNATLNDWSGAGFTSGKLGIYILQ